MRGNTNLDSAEYDSWLAKHGKERELMTRNKEKKNAHKSNGAGWHFGIDDKPVYAEDTNDLRRKLDARGLGIKDEIGRRRK